jgi:methylglyoxal synthase
MEKLIRRIGLVAHDAMKKDLIEWVLWNSELLMGHKFYCTGTTGTLIQEALKEKHPDVEWDFTILKSGPLGGDQQMGSRIVDGEIDYLFFFTDPMTLQPHDTDEGTDPSGKCGKHRLLLQPFHCRSYYFKSALP